MAIGLSMSRATVLSAQQGVATAPQAGAASEPQAVEIPETIVFSHNSTVTHQPFQLTMNNLVGGTIRYTTNGALPFAGSIAYAGPITINEPTVIRAQLFNDDGTAVGYPYTRSYIMANYEQTIPVISLVSDWGHFDTLHATARQRGKEWERPTNMEYFAPGGQVQFNVNAGIRIHGSKSRFFSPKKSFRIYFRKEYGGPGNLEYRLFGAKVHTAHTLLAGCMPTGCSIFTID